MGHNAIGILNLVIVKDKMKIISFVSEARLGNLVVSTII